MIDLFNQLREGDIFEQKIESGFRPIGSNVEIVEIKNSILKIVFLPKNRDSLLGDDETWIGIQQFLDKYRFVTSK